MSEDTVTITYFVGEVHIDWEKNFRRDLVAMFGEEGAAKLRASVAPTRESRDE